jgi:DNA adenine methylase
MGSKNRIAKFLLPIILEKKELAKNYIEPFVGGCNMIDKVSGIRRVVNDSNSYLISMWKALQEDWIPPEIVSKELYYFIKSNQNMLLDRSVGFVGFNCSFGSKWFGGYASNADGRNYALVAKNHLKKQITKLKDVVFTNTDYKNLIFESPSIIYCDPPYKETVKYKDGFDHDAFWKWVREKSVDNFVYVSEYSAPNDFECLIEIPLKTTLNKNKKENRIERLFKLKTS